jgi:threonine/homoserine/homoserine lactone efflux protein
MLPAETIVTFSVASIALGVAPGPDNLFVLTQSALHGRSAGIAVMLGLCTGLIGHTVAVALGVAAIFQTSTIAFSVLKVVGAAYLLHLAWKAFRVSAEKLEGEKCGEIGLWKLYRRGIIMNITNPKVSIFFLAFLPQFVDAKRSPISWQILTLGGLFILATILVFGSIALLAGTLCGWLNRSARAQRILNRVAGTVFVGLALKLATAER